MTSTDDATKNNAARDDAAKAIMRTYADNLQPPPVADIIARAEHTPDAPHAASPDRPRGRGPLVVAAASVAATIAVVTIAVTTANRAPDPGAATAAQPTPSTTPVRMAPACPPDLPMFEGPKTIEGTLIKPIAAKAGQQLTLPARIQPSDPDRPVLTFTIYLLPPGADLNERAPSVPDSVWVVAK